MPKNSVEKSDFVPPMSSSGSRLKSYQGGVEVPREDRNLKFILEQDFSKLDYPTQAGIIKILEEIRKLNPEEAKNAGKLLEQYFRGISQARDPRGLTDELTKSLERERNKKVQ